ncbi:hypothetical protein CPT03_06755 [Pedobacter ginsengisoli]|uniref:DUF4136 domain-containing protein n=1 Tax=Pedobacter ginsengisoli TaxID=363852 RepID=A0A2D1U3K2_9SPHI|nr:hypothetical protein [Pedobacter ginsengisoli]ATP56187.1 hypothetical protein CPT03_06755 [Pedobacter ginsengisoli]
MKKLLLPAAIGMVFLFALLLNACNSTKIISSWADAQGTIEKSNKILVIALMGAKDRNLKENVENITVQNLKAHGINAGSALAEYGPKAFEGLNEAEALKKIRNKGYDGTFTIALLDKTKQKRYNPGSVGMWPGPYRFWGYYHFMYGRIYEPGYYSVTNKFILEANFYSLNTEKLIYSVQTKSLDPSSPRALAADFNKRLFDDMVSKGVIK